MSGVRKRSVVADRRLRRWVAGLFAGVLTLFTAFVLLDTFVIPYRLIAVEPARSATGAPATWPSPAALPKGLDSQSEPLTHTDAYRAITIGVYRFDDANVYVADLVVTDPALMKVAFADDVYGRNVVATTSSQAAAAGAILAINGSFYGAREASYVVLNGRIYRDNPLSADQEDLAVMADGTLEVVREGDVTAGELVAGGAVDVLSFGPGLVVGGRAVVGSANYNGNGQARNPRTAIAQLGPLHYAFVVVDGRTTASAGLDLHQLADFLVRYGATTAYNLDGGGSSAMWFRGRVLNEPTTDGETIVEREISDIVYV